MRIKIHCVSVIVPVAVGISIILGGCSKKTVQVSSFPEGAPVKETVSVATPIAAGPIDSMAILEALMREALRNIYFDFNEYRLRTDATGQLNIIGKILMEHQNVSILIEGHCDIRGSSDYNMALGENRANATKKWLVAYGIADSKIRTNSYGNERLAVEGCADETCYQKNRRCEFKMDSFKMASF
jgi:peptidoglycan-associated lipoprotein